MALDKNKYYNREVDPSGMDKEEILEMQRFIQNTMMRSSLYTNLHPKEEAIIAASVSDCICRSFNDFYNRHHQPRGDNSVQKEMCFWQDMSDRIRKYYMIEEISPQRYYGLYDDTYKLS